MKILTMHDITVVYDRKAVLSRFSLTLERGEFLAVTGHNGGGKTTMLRVMLGLLKPTSGRVTYYDREGHPTRHLRIGYLPQKSNIDTRFPITVAEAVRSGMISGWLGRLPRDARERFDEVVALTGIGDYLDRAVGVLSGGQLQRTLLARALVCRPELLVLDEPLSYVDKDFEHRIYDLMADLSRHTTIVIVSHEMTAFDRLATRTLVLDN